nr:electron transfer flavoprotein beta subunit/FixA family protein [Desulfobacterales bacterium]
MRLNIVVCIKQVPHPEHFHEIKLDPESQTINRRGIPAILNPPDKHALEEALQLKERYGGTITAVSMGPPEASQIMEEAYALGVDRSILLCDPLFAGADTLATARALAIGIQRLGEVDLILCGTHSMDGATGQVGPQLAEILGFPFIGFVRKMEIQERGTVLAERTIERGYLKVEGSLPLVLSVTKEINTPRLPTVIGIMEATQKEIYTWDTKELGIDPALVGIEGSPTRVSGIFERRLSRKGELLQGDPEEVIRKAIKRLRELEALR